MAKKSLGQHWLSDAASLAAMCDAAGLKAGDVVLEIGPGRGTLTKILLERGAIVTAIEKDEQLAQTLRTSAQGLSLRIVEGDILKFDLTQLPAGYKIVANIPYYLTSHLIRIISESSKPPVIAALLVQKEVAERVTARAGEMSLLSITTQFYWKAEKGRVVPKALFTPAPKVDSQILILKRRPAPLFPGVVEKTFFQLVKAGFNSRRKTLENSLSGGLKKSKTEIRDLLKSAGISPQVRPQELTLKNWYNIYLNLDNLIY